MKKNRDAYYRPLPTPDQTKDCSGLRQFEGEDLGFEARNKFFKNKQKQWLDQQIQQKRQRKEQQKLQNQMYDAQTQELNRFRGMLQDDFQKTKQNMRNEQKQTNQMLDLQRKQKEAAQKIAHLNYQKQQANYLKERGAKKPFNMDVK